MGKYYQLRIAIYQSRYSKTMIPEKIYIDTNLFMLLVVGSTGKSLISKHDRLSVFDIEDYERLSGLVRRIGHVLVTPNILTEASNLLGQHRDPERSLIFHKLHAFIGETEEVFIDSVAAAGNNKFIRLGLTDAALLEVVSRSNPLITVDLDLYLAAAAIDGHAAFNFFHYQWW